MQPILNKSTITYGLLVGALIGASSRVWGQDDTTKNEDKTPIVAPLNPPPHLEENSKWVQELTVSSNLSEQLLTKVSILGESLDTEGKEYLPKLLQRTIGKENRTHLALTDTDGGGSQLIDHLVAIAIEPLHSRLEGERRKLLKEFIQELADPGELNQASWSVCGTAILYPLFLNSPAEGARLLRGLVSVEGKCRLRDGSTLERAPFSLLPDHTSGRSRSESLLMSALMDRANGPLKYCAVCDSHFDVTHGNISHIGLTNTEICVLYKAVFNKEFSWMEYPSNPADTLISQLGSLSSKHQFVPASIRWNQSESIPQRFRHPRIVNEEQHESMVLIAQGSQSVRAEGYHHILVTGIRSERVFFRNLHGKSDQPSGTELTNPPRRVEDPKQGIESMAMAEFKKRISTVYIEKD